MPAGLFPLLQGRQEAYSPDSKRIVSRGSDMTVRVWDAGTGDALLTFHTQGGCLERGRESGRQTDHQRPPGPDRESVGRWHRPGHCHIGGSPATVTNVAWSPDGKHVLSGDWPNMVKIWEAGRQRATPEVKISSALPVANW